ncbi:hypothetical protein HUE58_04900 [Candidatus Ruthia endofausta]|uniref:Uncharacterized protein n=1 Tax=Candidatus Ruthia endofausta TaxID=2738852 RepID=A0A6N0HQ53_9GAMM|nr:hypothetical protein [Candidatus Ruthia endofausta]QKQ24457.1 hypothetical protein HUE58_04900 [Candidatus Ruthia endofausta]
MRVITTQEQAFADSVINIPDSQLDTINKIYLINFWVVSILCLRRINLNSLMANMFVAMDAILIQT